MNYRPSQSAAVCDAALKAAVRDMDEARHRAVLWFADIRKRQLYRDLGFANMAAYATDELKFSKTRTNDFLRLAGKLEELPRVRASLASGDLGYTKAVEIVKVATPKTEAAWVDKARSTGRRELANQVKRVKTKAANRRKRQPEILPAPPEETGLAAEVPLEIRLTMSPEKLARYEALFEKLGAATRDRAEVLLAGLEALVQERAAGTSCGANDCQDEGCAKATRRRVAGVPFRVHVHQCPDCAKSTVQTRRGEFELGLADAERVSCDSTFLEPGQRARSSIPPRVRADVLARDRHRCQAPGCSHTRFLEVHHIKPRSHGGGNNPSNLVTLCAGCHRLHHEGKLKSASEGYSAVP